MTTNTPGEDLKTAIRVGFRYGHGETAWGDDDRIVDSIYNAVKDHLAAAEEETRLDTDTTLRDLTRAVIAIGRLTTAILEHLEHPTPPAGNCTSIINFDTGYGTPLGETETCEHPHGHTGAHTSTKNGVHIWTDGAPGARRIDQPDTTTDHKTCGGTHVRDLSGEIILCQRPVP